MGQDEHLEISEKPDQTPTSPDTDNSPTEWDQYLNVPPSEDLSVGDETDDTPADGAEKNPIESDGRYTDGDILVMASDADVIAPIDLKLDGISKQLSDLHKEFQIKIKNDAHKDKVIDNLHQELQQYKNNHLKKYLLPTIMDIIQFIDGLRKLIKYLTLQRPEESDPQIQMKLTKLLKSIPSDLEDICFRQGISPFKCSDKAFNPGRQRILKKIQTEDIEKDKTVAESLRPGYVWDGEVIRPEVVSVYIFKAPEAEIETGNADE